MAPPDPETLRAKLDAMALIYTPAHLQTAEGKSWEAGYRAAITELRAWLTEAAPPLNPLKKEGPSLAEIVKWLRDNGFNDEAEVVEAADRLDGKEDGQIGGNNG